MPIVQSDKDNGAGADVDLSTADHEDEHEEVVEVKKTKPATKAKASKAAPAKKVAAAATKKTAKATAPTKVAAKPKATKAATKAKGRGRKRGWPTGVARNGQPAREKVLKLLKQKLSPSEVARKAGVTPQRVYQIRKSVEKPSVTKKVAKAAAKRKKAA